MDSQAIDIGAWEAIAFAAGWDFGRALMVEGRLRTIIDRLVYDE
jgi:hypothetical protein